jgi:hypothetical protein
MEVVLSSADSQDARWSCQISLRFMYDAGGKRLDDPQVIKFGERLYDPTDVERRLKMAQDAILQLPHEGAPDLATYLQEDHIVSPKTVGFSRNVVRLDVAGPDLVDVTFIDLPGIIQNSDKVHPKKDMLTVRNGWIR